LLHILSSIYIHGSKHLGPTQNHSQSKTFEIQKLKSSIFKQVILFSRPIFFFFSTHTKMGFRLPGIIRKTSSSKDVYVPKGYLAVYVGEEMKRFVIPISYLNQPSFQDLLNQAEEQFEYDHPAGGLTIPCREDVFLDITSRLSRC
jgi:SAUR family protein